MKTLVTAAAVAALAFGSANAAVVNFESAGPEGTPVLPTDFNDAGISFTSTDGLQIVQVGAPQTGFNPDDTVVPDGAFGDFFLGTDFDDNETDLTITYLTPVDALSFDLADIDDDEVFSITFNFSDGSSSQQTITAGDPGTGNQEVFRVGIDAPMGLQITSVVINGTRGSGRLGIAFDNFNTTVNTAVPLPAAAPLFLAGLGGIAAYRRRRA